MRDCVGRGEKPRNRIDSALTSDNCVFFAAY